MDKEFNPKKYGMLVCPICDGCGRIQYAYDVRVCQHCGGFGFIREEVKRLDQEGKPIFAGGQ